MPVSPMPAMVALLLVARYALKMLTVPLEYWPPVGENLGATMRAASVPTNRF